MQNSSDTSNSCNRARSAIAGNIFEPLGTRDAQRLADHLATCDACCTYRDECSSLWESLGKLEPLPSPSNARARFDDLLRAEGARDRVSVAPLRSRPWLKAAAIVLALGAGYAGGVWSGRSAPLTVRTVAPPDSLRQFILLVRGPGTSEGGATPAAIQALVEEYTAWAARLHADGQLVSAEKLVDDSGEMLGPGSVDPEAQRIGGFFVIRARDLLEASRIAKTCPHLRHGGQIELRAIEST